MSFESQPINRPLFNSLRTRFGVVKIANEGERRLTRLVRNIPSAKPEIEVLQAGEQYRVCCPYCSDTRFRLYVCYLWNSVNEKGERQGRGLIHCFNEGCVMRHFEDELKPYIMGNVTITRSAEDAASRFIPFQPVAWPGRCVPLNGLPPEHPARQYMLQRRFDPDELFKMWDVHYCVEAAEDEGGLVPRTTIVANYVRNRIMIPIYRSGHMVGWQARAVGDKHVGPKYYTMPGLRKTQLIYNGDRARQYPFGVIVEGVTSAWRVGPRAGALLGKSMSHHQQKLVHQYWQTGGMCLLLDPDAIEQMETIMLLLGKQSFRWGAFHLPLPDDRDPADFEHDELWGLIVNYARVRGVQLAPS